MKLLFASLLLLAACKSEEHATRQDPLNVTFEDKHDALYFSVMETKAKARVNPRGLPGR